MEQFSVQFYISLNDKYVVYVLKKMFALCMNLFIS